MNSKRQKTQENMSSAIIINPFRESYEPQVNIHSHFTSILKPHQIEGIQYMWKRVVSNNLGGILAHSMGLGKTLQTIVFIATLALEIDHNSSCIPDYLHTKRVLILAPTITLSNWANEFNHWLIPEIQEAIGHIYKIHDATMGRTALKYRLNVLEAWHRLGGVLLMSYDQFRILARPQTGVTVNPIEKYLLKPGPSLLITDEGHRIKNIHAQITQIVSQVLTPAHLCLTGYPLQNNLSEYYCILNFSSPGLFGDPLFFRREFQKAIESSFSDSSPSQKYLAKRALYKLQLLSWDSIHRKDTRILVQELPPKTEYVINCTFSDIQYTMYEKTVDGLRNAETSPMVGLVLLRAICNHPAIFIRMSEMKYSSKRRKTVHQQLCTVASNDPWKDSTGEREDMDEDEDDDMERFDIEDDSDDEEKDSNELKLIESFDTEKIANWVLSISDTLDVSWDSSIKMRIIIHIVTKAKEIGEKVLIVSHSLLFLDFIQSTMFHLGLSLLRIDGNTQQGDRQPLIDRFNQLPYEYVMLISARAGSIGVNIVGASRIILCDLDWNPCHDEQGIGRVYRYGQTKPVFVYRLVTHATIEARLMVQSIHKRGISSQVIDNKKMTPQLQSEMKGYYKLPNKKEMSVPYDSTTPIADTILQSVVENLHMNIFDIQLGDELISQDHEPSIELEESDIRTVQKEVQKAKMQFRASILNKYI